MVRPICFESPIADMIPGFNEQNCHDLQTRGWVMLPISICDMVSLLNGRLLLDPISGVIVDRLETHAHNKPRSYLSHGITGGELPLHTDYPNLEPKPPRYIGLSVVGENCGGRTVVFRMFEFLRQAPFGSIFFRTQRRVPCRLRMWHGRQSLTHICDRADAELTARYAWNCMSPLFDRDMVFFKHVADLDRAYPGFTETIELRGHATLIIDNHRCLHGRRMLESNRSNQGRTVRRILFA